MTPTMKLVLAVLAVAIVVLLMSKESFLDIDQEFAPVTDPGKPFVVTNVPLVVASQGTSMVPVTMVPSMVPSMTPSMAPDAMMSLDTDDEYDGDYE